MKLGSRIAVAIMSLVVIVSLAPAPAMAGSYEAVAIQSSTSTSLFAGVGKAKIPKKKVRVRYKAVLRDAARGKAQFAAQYRQADAFAKRYWKSGLRYAVHDVDKNGTPELLVRAGSYSTNTCWHAFTVSGYSTRHLGTFPQGILMTGKSGSLDCWNQRMGVRWVHTLAITRGGVLSIPTLYDTDELHGYPDYQRYASEHRLKALKTSSVTSYKLLKSKVK